jgi:hypothetical protein
VRKTGVNSLTITKKTIIIIPVVGATVVVAGTVVVGAAVVERTVKI